MHCSSWNRVLQIVVVPGGETDEKGTENIGRQTENFPEPQLDDALPATQPIFRTIT